MLPCVRFRQARSGACDQDIANQIVRFMGRKNENFSIGTSLLDLARGNQAIELGQRQIENDHIRLEREGQLHRLPTGRRLTTDLPAKMLIENGAQSISTGGAVLGDQDPDHLSAQSRFRPHILWKWVWRRASGYCATAQKCFSRNGE